MFRSITLRPVRCALALSLASVCLAGLAGADTPAFVGEGPGWLPTDFRPHPDNPLMSFGVDHPSQSTADRVFPVVMRVDDKLAEPLDGHPWYLWLWRHGLSPRNMHNGGRMQLLTAERLDGPWIDRGFVTPADMTPEGWGPYSWTGGDVVWSERHRKFFSVPHAYRNRAFQATPPNGLDSFLMESPDGVNWTLSAVPQPVLPISVNDGDYDRRETGYGRLLRLGGSGTAERWIWMYRAARGNYYTLAVATAGDIYGPWEKADYNPVFDPQANGTFTNGGAQIGLNAFVCYEGYYQIIWESVTTGTQALARSTDLKNWESFRPFEVGDSRPFGQNNSVPFYTGTGPHEAIIRGGTLVYDPDVDALTFLYVAWDAQNLVAALGVPAPGHVTLNIARSESGGVPPQTPASRNPAKLADACAPV